MSKTYRDTLRAKSKIIRRKADEEWKACRKTLSVYTTVCILHSQLYTRLSIYNKWHDNLSYLDQLKIFSGFGKNSGAWNNLYSTRPSRRKQTTLLRQVSKGIEVENWPDYKRPFTYEW